MILISFNFKNIKYFFKNLIYFYITSILFGGIISFLNINYSQNSDSLVFINRKNPNIIIIFIIGIILMYFYLKQIKDLKNNYNKYYKVELEINNKKIKLNGFLDTGNKLVDPYKKRPIILVNKLLIQNNNLKKILVPYSSVNNHNLLECIKVKNIKINDKKVKKDCLIGLMDNVNIDGIDCILNERVIEC